MDINQFIDNYINELSEVDDFTEDEKEAIKRNIRGFIDNRTVDSYYTDVGIYFDYLKDETKYAVDFYESIKETQSSEYSSEVIEIKNAIKKSLISTGDSLDMSKAVFDLLNTDPEQFHNYLCKLDDSIEKEVFNSILSQIQECIPVGDDTSLTTNVLLSHVGFDICNSNSEELLSNPQVTLADNSDDSFIPFESNPSFHTIPTDKIDPIWKECFLSVCKSYKGQFGMCMSWYQFFRLYKANMLLNEKLDEKDRRMAYALNVMSNTNLSHEKKKAVYEASARIYTDDYVSFEKMERKILDKSCIPIFMRYFAKCVNCRTYFDNGSQFCPECINKPRPVIQELWKKCDTKSCICNHYNETELLSFDIDHLKEFQCRHMKRPFFEGSLYISPIGIIADLIHMGIYKRYIGVTRQSLLALCCHCINIGCHNSLISLNMAKVCESVGFNDVAEEIKKACKYHDVNSISVLQSLSNNRSFVSPNERVNILNNFHNNTFSSEVRFFILNKMLSHDIMGIVIQNCLDDDKATMDIRSYCTTTSQNWKYLVDVINNDLLLQNTLQSITDDCINTLPMNKQLRYLSIFDLYQQYDSNFPERGFYHSTAKTLLKMSLEDISNSKDLPQKIGHKSFSLEYGNVISLKRLCEDIEIRYSENCCYPIKWRNDALVTTSFFVALLMLNDSLIIMNNSNPDYESACSLLSAVCTFYHAPVDISLDQTNVEKCYQCILGLLSCFKELKGLPRHVAALEDMKSLILKGYIDHNVNQVSSISADYSSFYPDFSFENAPKDNIEPYSNDIELQQLLNILKTCENYVPVETISKDLIPLSLSYDGVSIHKNSSNSNSVIPITAYFENSPFFLKYTSTDMWFATCSYSNQSTGRKGEMDKIVNTSDKPILGITKMNNSKRANLKRQEKLEDEVVRKSKKQNKIVVTKHYEDSKQKLNAVSEKSYYFSEQSIPQLSPSEGEAKQMMDLVMQDIFRLSQYGFPIINKTHIHYIYPVVTFLKFDNPAGDSLDNNKGLQSSFRCCRDCEMIKKSWIPSTNTLSNDIEHDDDDNKLERTILSTAFAGLDRDDCLRVLSLVNYLSSLPENEIARIIYPTELDKDVKYIEHLIEIIKALKDACIKDPHFLWIGPVTDYWPCYSSEEFNKTKEKINENYFGYLNVLISSFLGKDLFRFKDIMHILENLYGYFDCFLKTALKDIPLETMATKSKKATKRDKDKKSEKPPVSMLFKRELLFDNIIYKDLPSPNFPIDIYIAARNLVEANNCHLKGLKSIIDIFLPPIICYDKIKLTESQKTLNAEESMKGLFCICIWLFYNYGNAELLSTYVRLFHALGRFYYLSGSVEEALALQKEIRILVFYLENEKCLDSTSLIFHYCLHLFECYLFCGRLIEANCIYCESNYKKLKESPDSYNSLHTLSERLKEMTIYSILEDKTKQNTLFLLSVFDDGWITGQFRSISYAQLKIRILSSYKSTCSYRTACCSFLNTLEDIELCSTIPAFLANEMNKWNIQPNKIVKSDYIVPSSDEEIMNFARKVIPEWEQDNTVNSQSLSSIRLYHQCRIDGKTFSSVDKQLYELTNEYILQNENGFGLTIDVRGNIHLFAIMGYFSVQIKTENYPMAFVYEVPITHYCKEKPYNYCFKICCSDFTYNPVKTVISINRLIIDKKCFVTNYEGSITCMMYHLNAFQFVNVNVYVNTNTNKQKDIQST